MVKDFVLVPAESDAIRRKPKHGKLGVKEACEIIKADGLEVVNMGIFKILLDIQGYNKQLPPNIEISMLIFGCSGKEIVAFGDAIVIAAELFDNSVDPNEFEIVKHARPDLFN